MLAKADLRPRAGMDPSHLTSKLSFAMRQSEAARAEGGRASRITDNEWLRAATVFFYRNIKFADANVGFAASVCVFSKRQRAFDGGRLAAKGNHR